MTKAEEIQFRERLAMVEAQLSEHCHSLQILASFPAEGGGTRAVKVGAGDWYSRRALAMEFIEEDQAQTQAHALARRINPPDEGDWWMQAQGDF